MKKPRGDRLWRQPLPKGAMTRIARKARCSIGHVSRVYHGERSSKLIELLIQQERDLESIARQEA